MGRRDVQKSHRDDPIVTPGGGQVEVRISMHVGVPQIDPGDPDNFVGKSVDYASRLNDYATGGQILVSRSVMAILDDVGLEGMRLHLHGRRNLKGIGNVEVHETALRRPRPAAAAQQPQTTPSGSGRSSPRSWAFDGRQRRRLRWPRPRCSSASATTNSKSCSAPAAWATSTRPATRSSAASARSRSSSRSSSPRATKRSSAGSTTRSKRSAASSTATSSWRSTRRRPTTSVHYLVMEYIEGVSLDELVAQQGRCRVPEACEIIRQAARGLQYIHKQRHGPPRHQAVELDGHAGRRRRRCHSDSSLTAGEPVERRS